MRNESMRQHSLIKNIVQRGVPSRTHVQLMLFYPPLDLVKPGPHLSASGDLPTLLHEIHALVTRDLG
jgi:hypothetical protein